ncbi:MAG: host attachment protein [Mariprofundaceae bacterium]
MAKTWVLAADSSRARLYAADKPNSPLSELKAFEHPEGRMHEQELTSDLPGRAFDSGGMGRHAMGQSVGPKQQEALNFARSLVGCLESSHRKGHFSELYVLAPPAFLGLLREYYSSSLNAAVKQEVGKNVSMLAAQEVRTHLPEYL